MIRIGKKEIWLPSDYYKYLYESGNKSHFWTATTSCFTILFTLWIGLSIQFMVIDQNKVQSDRITHMQLVDKLYPVYKEYNDSCRMLYEDIMKYISEEYSPTSREDTIAIAIVSGAMMKTNLYNAAIKSVEISSRVQYYYPESVHKRILKNNARLLIATKMMNMFEINNLSKREYYDSLKNFVYSNRFGFYTIATYEAVPLEEKYERLDSLTNVFWELYFNARKSVLLDSLLAESYYYVRIGMDEILPYLSSNSFLMSEELEKTSYQKGTNPILFILSSFIIIVVVGFVIWVLIINLIFNKKRIAPNQYSLDDHIEIQKQIDAMSTRKEDISSQIYIKKANLMYYKSLNCDIEERIESLIKKEQI